MAIYKDSLYFSIATHEEFREKYELTYGIINNILSFFQSYTDISLMFNYIDSKGVKINKVTQKNRDKLYQKLKDKDIYQFMIAEYVKSKEYYDTSENQRQTSTLSCTIDFMDYGVKCYGISVSVPTCYMISTKAQEDFILLFKELNCLINGFNSFISRGSCFPTFSADSLSVLDSVHISNKNTWDNCVRGYFWGNTVNEKIVEKIGGIKCISEQGFYKVEKWQENLYIQVSENIMEYSIADAAKIRKLLLPAFPLNKERNVVYENAESYHRAKMLGIENFMIEEDLI